MSNLVICEIVIVFPGQHHVKAHINEIPGPDQKIFQIRFVSNLDICKIVNECPGQHHVKAQVWSFET